MSKKSLKSLIVMLCITVIGVVPVFANIISNVSTSNSASASTSASASVSQLMAGDINADSVVNLLDAQLALRLALGIESDDVKALNDAQKLAADVDGIAGVDLRDAQIVLKMALGIPV